MTKKQRAKAFSVVVQVFGPIKKDGREPLACAAQLFRTKNKAEEAAAWAYSAMAAVASSRSAIS
jgi:hypothetical protein